jgi:hypothetical protein
MYNWSTSLSPGKRGFGGGGGIPGGGGQGKNEIAHRLGIEVRTGSCVRWQTWWVRVGVRVGVRAGVGMI